MGAAVEVLLAFLAGIGLIGLGWLLFGRVLAPAGGAQVCAVVPGRGNGANLEQAVAGLLWLRGGGLLQGRVIIADCGLTQEGRDVARILSEREECVAFCPSEQLGKYIEGR